MKNHFVYRTYLGKYNQFQQFQSLVRKNGGVEDWSATKKFAVGDLVLIYFTEPVASIVAIGKVNSDLHEYEGPFRWSKRKQATFCDFKPIWLLANPVRLLDAANRLGLQKWYRASPFRRPHELKSNIAQRLVGEIVRLNPEIRRYIGKMKVSIPREEKQFPRHTSSGFQEGDVQEITLELRKRNPHLRAQAVAELGYSCQVCGFNFDAFYGSLGTGYIEVHHLHLLSEKKSKQTTTIKDVAVVCANCHRILHRNSKRPLSLKLLHEAIQSQKKRKGKP